MGLIPVVNIEGSRRQWRARHKEPRSTGYSEGKDMEQGELSGAERIG